MFDYNKYYNAEVNRGWGFAVGKSDSDINEISGIGDLIEKSQSSDRVAVYRDGSKVTIVGDSNGPWAVEFTPTVLWK